MSRNGSDAGVSGGFGGSGVATAAASGGLGGSAGGGVAGGASSFFSMGAAGSGIFSRSMCREPKTVSEDGVSLAILSAGTWNRRKKTLTVISLSVLISLA